MPYLRTTKERKILRKKSRKTFKNRESDVLPQNSIKVTN